MGIAAVYTPRSEDKVYWGMIMAEPHVTHHAGVTPFNRSGGQARSGR